MAINCNCPPIPALDIRWRWLANQYQSREDIQRDFERTIGCSMAELIQQEGAAYAYSVLYDFIAKNKGYNISIPSFKDGKCDCGTLTFCKCGAENPKTPGAVQTHPIDPIILDLDGDGVETVSINDGVYFDHDGNMFAEKTGWAGADDAFLVWDRNQNGLIDDGSELFGNNYTMADGRKATHGFEALAEFDSNGDGVVDRNDDRWSELLLWQDRNGNGVVDDGEILTLEQAGVAGLNVDYINQRYTDANGNEHRQAGSFIRDDGALGEMNDVWFKADITDTQYLEDLEIPDEVQGLPNLKGYGNTPSLHQAMALDPGGRLQSLMEQFVNCTDPWRAKELVEDIIFSWTGVNNADPRSRGGLFGRCPQTSGH